MSTRRFLDEELDRLRNHVLDMGQLVEAGVKNALQALETLDQGLARQIIEADQLINSTRYTIEDDCFRLIATQQPAASDLRKIVAVMNIIVDLEQIGDKAKDIAEAIFQVKRFEKSAQPAQLRAMGDLVVLMLRQSLQAYAEGNIELGRHVASRDVDVNHMFDAVVNEVIERMAKAKKEKKVTSSIGLLDAAQHLKRMGDLITNIVERVIYISTGSVQEFDSRT